MLRATSLSLRYRNPWRNLLHPLPIFARKEQWRRRENCDMNEDMLRRPYYRLKAIDDDARAARDALVDASASPGVTGPPLPDAVGGAVPDGTTQRLYPAYPESAFTVPPHEQSMR